ncbi:MAG: hypothetical protein V4850_05270 [Myxococcota bacterium]
MKASPVPSNKDLAEFYRLALASRLCAPADVAAWADTIVAAEENPDPVFLDLSCSGSLRADVVQTALHEVPGSINGNLPVYLLLGHGSRVLAAGGLPAGDLLLRLHALARLEAMPSDVDDELSSLEDAYSLACDGVFGTLAEFGQRVAEFLARYDAFVPPAVLAPIR